MNAWKYATAPAYVVGSPHRCARLTSCPLAPQLRPKVRARQLDEQQHCACAFAPCNLRDTSTVRQPERGAGHCRSRNTTRPATARRACSSCYFKSHSLLAHSLSRCPAIVRTPGNTQHRLKRDGGDARACRARQSATPRRLCLPADSCTPTRHCASTGSANAAAQWPGRRSGMRAGSLGEPARAATAPSSATGSESVSLTDGGVLGELNGWRTLRWAQSARGAVCAASGALFLGWCSSSSSLSSPPSLA